MCRRRPGWLDEFVDALAEIEVTVENELLKGAPQGYAMMNAIKTASGSWRTARCGMRRRS
jgi:hypothetical protein